MYYAFDDKYGLKIGGIPDHHYYKLVHEWTNENNDDDKKLDKPVSILQIFGQPK